MSSPRRKINFATTIILVTVCQHVRNGGTFYRVIIVTATKKGFSARRRGMAGRRRSWRALRACSWRYFLPAKILRIVKGDGRRRCASSLLPLLLLLHLAAPEGGENEWPGNSDTPMWILDIFLQGDPRRVSSLVGEKFFMSEAYNNMLIRDSGATSLSLSLE